ncbi:uncharacterized protein LOC143085247 [Mytilus galloprovincialis]|uniref:uncharacterized protein LOC143085247 n=1 Tax=Mytilus galloprovincialis TaxID=29158 RepID=UPI003F7BD0E9
MSYQETQDSLQGSTTNHGNRSDECENLKKFENAFNLVRSDISKHSTEIKRLEEDKSRLSISYENEKENSKRTKNGLEAEVKQLQNEKNIQVDELKRTELKLVEAQEESNKYHESNEKLRNYNSELETHKTALELKHKEHDKLMRKSESELRQLEKDRKQLQQKVNEFEKRFISVQKQKTVLHDNNIQLELENEKLSDKTRDLTSKFQEYLDSNQAYKDQNSELLKDIGKARREIKAQNEKSKVAKETYEREKTCNDDVLRTKEDIICILKSENQKLKDINHTKEQEITKMKEIEKAKHVQMKSQMEDLENKLKSSLGLQKEKKRLYKVRMESIELDFALFKERISGSREHFKKEDVKCSSSAKTLSSKVKQPVSSDRLSLRSMNKTLRNKLKRMEAEKETIEGRLQQAQELLVKSEIEIKKIKENEVAFKNIISEERNKASLLKEQCEDLTSQLETNCSEKEKVKHKLAEKMEEERNSSQVIECIRRDWVDHQLFMEHLKKELNKAAMVFTHKTGPELQQYIGILKTELQTAQHMQTEYNGNVNFGEREGRIRDLIHKFDSLNRSSGNTDLVAHHQEMVVSSNAVTVKKNENTHHINAKNVTIYQGHHVQHVLTDDNGNITE